MSSIVINFTFHSGIKRHLFKNARLSGSWDTNGRFTNQWSTIPMTAITDETGCDAFSASVSLDNGSYNPPKGEPQGDAEVVFQWGVEADLPNAPNTWIIVTEVPDQNSSQRYRSFILSAANTSQEYWFVTGRRIGAQKCSPAGSTTPGLRFSVWAPNAKSVDVVFAPFDPSSGAPTGYIADDGTGIDPATPAVPLKPSASGFWESNTDVTAALATFSNLMNRLYMYRIVNEQGATTYKVDIFSRSQVGRGAFDPGGLQYTGSYTDLDGTVSCSVISDPDQVTSNPADTGIVKETLISADEFWASEYTGGIKPPTNLQDLIIYELHVGALGYPDTTAGDFLEAIDFVDSLVELGVNAVELLPVLEFDGDAEWGYGTSLYFCLQSSAGGANQIKHFVRKCHQHGIAVILDVVYNHYPDSGTERTEWGYDSDPDVAPQHNIFNWFEGQYANYPGVPDGGYLDNGSSGFAPRYSEEVVRQMFTSSAAALLDDFHIDGFRVDLTDAIHQDNRLHANGASVAAANQFGINFLREFARTVKLVNPSAFLMAEDYTGWNGVTQTLDDGGLGFDAIWYADFYHHLIGDGDYGDSYAKLIKNAGYGVSGSLNMDYFAGALLATQSNKITYHETHDEAGNADNTERTILTAVNKVLTPETRSYAEARCRFACGMSLLSAGTPLFFMGEEIGAQNYFRYNDFLDNKENLIGDRTTSGKNLFTFYKDLIAFVRSNPATRSTQLDVIYTHNDNRVIAFTRFSSTQELLVAASLNDAPFDHGYVIGTDPARLPSGQWQEVFNSDSELYGGSNTGNGGLSIAVSNGTVNLILPARGFVILWKTA